MANDLDMLIDFYQWEIVRIKSAIDENLELYHYKEVEFNQRALAYAQSELDRLLELKNPLHRKIKRAEQSLEMYKRLKQKRESANEELFWSEYYDEKIKEQKRDLIELQKIKVEDKVEESQFIDEALFSLLKGEGSKLTLKFNETEDYTLSVLIEGNRLFKLNFYARHNELSWLYEHTLLKELGFETSEEKNVLSRDFFLENPKNVLPLKELISAIVIGLKHPLRIKSEIYLRIE